MGAAAKLLVPERTFEEYFDCSTADTSDSGPDQFEVIHLGYISSIPAGLWDTSAYGALNLFKECDAKWLFFIFFTRYFTSLKVNGEDENFAVKR